METKRRKEENRFDIVSANPRANTGLPRKVSEEAEGRPHN